MTKVEERIFGRDFRGSCLHKQGCENEASLTVCGELSICCIENRLACCLALKEKWLLKIQLFYG